MSISKVRMLGGVVVTAGVVVFAGAPVLADPGDPDSSFGGDGTVTTHFGEPEPRGLAGLGRSVAVAPNGDIVMVGTTTNYTGPGDEALARYRPNGELVASFGDDGKVIVDGQARVMTEEVDIGPTGGIVVVSTLNGRDDPVNEIIVRRHRADGTLDQSFGENGAVRTDLGDEASAVDVDIDQQGRVVVAATIGEYRGISDIAIARYTADGQLDAGFADDGIAIADHGHRDHAAALDIGPDGSITVVGDVRVTVDEPIKTSVMRFSTTGELDAEFGNPRTRIGHANGVTHDAEGRLLVTGGAIFRRLVFRYFPDGRLDDSFGRNGVVAEKTTPSAGGEAYGVKVGANGNVFVGVNGGVPSTRDYCVVRSRTNGTRAAGFGDNGLGCADFRGGSHFASDVVLGPNGRIVLAGLATNWETHGDKFDFGIARFLNG